VGSLTLFRGHHCCSCSVQQDQARGRPKIFARRLTHILLPRLRSISTPTTTRASVAPLPVSAKRTPGYGIPRVQALPAVSVIVFLPLMSQREDIDRSARLDLEQCHVPDGNRGNDELPQEWIVG